jgi:putative flippase GtrA
MIGYLLYLLITGLGAGHKITMSGLYAVGVLQTFAFNRNWSFRHRGHLRSAAVRYVLAYAAGYVLNLLVLLVLVDHWGLPHEIVQGGMIVFLAVFLFLLQRYWVFSSTAARVAPHQPPDAASP